MYSDDFDSVTNNLRDSANGTFEHIVDLVRFAPMVQVLDALVPQLAEQLVEVPTIISFFSLQRIVEQNVAIPVPGGERRHADFQGFLRGQSSTGVEQIVDLPGGGLQGFRPGQSSSASSSSPAGVHENPDEPGEGVFSTFSPT